LIQHWGYNGVHVQRLRLRHANDQSMLRFAGSVCGVHDQWPKAVEKESALPKMGRNSETEDNVGTNQASDSRSQTFAIYRCRYILGQQLLIPVCVGNLNASSKTSAAAGHAILLSIEACNRS
jgi:hypothetical protein